MSLQFEMLTDFSLDNIQIKRQFKLFTNFKTIKDKVMTNETFL